MVLSVVAVVTVPWRPVPGGVPPPVPVAEVFSPAEIARGEGYARWARIWSYTGLTISLLTYGMLAWRRRAVARWVRRGSWWLQAVQAVVVVLAIQALVTAPTNAAARQHRLNAGLTHQSWPGWLRDQLVSLGVSVAAVTLVVVVIGWLSRRLPRAWPAAAAAVAATLALAFSFVWPVVVEPLFNRFEALPSGQLRTQVIQLAHRQGAPVSDVLIADASRRTTTLNAYVSGFGASRRVVVYDTLLASPQPQILAVVSHELSHAIHDDPLIGAGLGALGAAAGMGLLGVIVARRRGAPRARLAAGDAGWVPAVLALSAVATFAVSPVSNGVSRMIETRADVDAVAATRDGRAVEAIQRELVLAAHSDPAPPALLQWWFGTHPAPLLRIAIARHLGGQ